MASDPINLKTFVARAKKIHAHWVSNKQNPKVWKNADAICIVAGATDENAVMYSGSSTFHRYLFSLELPSTIVLFTEKKVVILTSKKKKEILEKAQFDGDVALEVIEKVKAEEYGANCATLIAAVKASLDGATLGTLLKESPGGKFAASWAKALEKTSIATVDCSTGINLALAVKTEDEIMNIRKASHLSYKAMKAFSKRMWTVVDEDKGTFKHSELAAEIDANLEDPTERMQVKNVDKDMVESCYTPTVQSGPKCKVSLNEGAEMENEKMSFDLITCQLGARYDSYCSNVARTYIVNPPDCMEKAYMLLLEVQQVCLSAMKDSVSLLNVYNAAKKHIEAHGKDMLQYFTPNCGTGLGLMIRDASHVMSHKNKRVMKAGMVFNLCVGFQDVPVALGKKDAKKPKVGARALPTYTLLLGDTVLVGKDEAEVLTKSAKKNWSTVAQTLDESEEEEEEEEEENLSRREKRDRAQAEATAKNIDLDQKRQEIMKKKAADVKRRNLARKQKGSASDEVAQKDSDAELQISAYSSVQRIPASIKPTRLTVDTENQAVLLPIYNMLVPFHITTVKNVSINDEGHRASYLTINFYSPADKVTKNMPPSVVRAIEDLVARKVFVRSMMFKSKDQKYLNDQLRAIKQLQKDTREKNRAENEAKDVIEQEPLVLWPRDRGRPLTLAPVSVRPKIGKYRKNQGSLQCHMNGFRFRANEGSDRVDIIYSNVRHFIFQQCDGTIHDVILNIHLRSPILVNKRKCKNLCFYMTIIEASEALDDSRRNMYDPDEIDEEQRQRKLRKRLNKQFYEFCKKVSKHVEKYAPDAVKPIFPKLDTPYLDLSFFGVAHKEMVRISPSVDCLLNVSHTPSFVVSLDDVEHFHLERVTFTTKNFDMVVVFNDLQRFKHVNSIEMRYLETIKEWIISIGKTFTTGNAPIVWDKTLTAVRDELDAELDDGTSLFWSNVDEQGEKKDVGWDFLNAHSDHEDDGDDDDDDDGSVFEVDSDEEESSSEDDWDEDDMAEESGLDSEAYSDSEEDGEDWAEMDRKAEKEDRKKRQRDSHREDRYRKKRRR